MTQTHTGWIIFLAGLGMMCGLLAADIVKLHEWRSVATPEFVGTALGHFAAVITAFIGGKLLPTDAEPGGRRASDPPPLTPKE
jgi:hypothetical protein